MTIDEIKEKKQQLEKDINKLINNFKNDTGITPSSVSVIPGWINNYGISSSSYVLVNCEITIEI